MSLPEATEPVFSYGAGSVSMPQEALASHARLDVGAAGLTEDWRQALEREAEV